MLKLKAMPIIVKEVSSDKTTQGNKDINSKR
jgi:hypothetical protein